jgi:phosphatidylglycerol:prolipoprotein diacylglycerol transferase
MNSFLLPAPFATFVDAFDPVILHLYGPISIRWYGVAYLCGFVAAILLWLRASKTGRTSLSPTLLEELFTWEIAGVLVGGRLGYMVFYDLPGFLADPLSILRVYDGGMSFHGGFLGVVLAMICFSRMRKISLWHLGDLGAAAAPLGLFFGRIANFVNGELWGKVSDAPWAMIFPKAPLVEAVPTVYYETALASGLANPRHPSPLYEALCEGVLLGIVMLVLFWRKGGALPKARPGLLSGLFLILYSFARIFCELFREPDASLFFGISRGTFYSLFMLCVGIGIVLFVLTGKRGNVAAADLHTKEEDHAGRSE